MFTGAIHERSADVFAPVADNDVGASGKVYADVLMAAVGVPTPAAFTANTRKRIGVPFVNPVTVAVRNPPVVDTAEDQVIPPSND